MKLHTAFKKLSRYSGLLHGLPLITMKQRIDPNTMQHCTRPPIQDGFNKLWGYQVPESAPTEASRSATKTIAAYACNTGARGLFDREASTLRHVLTTTQESGMK